MNETQIIANLRGELYALAFHILDNKQNTEEQHAKRVLEKLKQTEFGKGLELKKGEEK